LAILGRGYSITLNQQGKALRAADEVTVGERLHIRLHQGALDVSVETPPSKTE
jgi:exodeoxyribonuclease VII large subunit